MNKFEEKSDDTNEKLVGAFWDLMGEKSIQKIRIKDITDRAGVYRSTFYLHYMDVYDRRDHVRRVTVRLCSKRALGVL